MLGLAGLAVACVHKVLALYVLDADMDGQIAAHFLDHEVEIQRFHHRQLHQDAALVYGDTVLAAIWVNADDNGLCWFHYCYP